MSTWTFNSVLKGALCGALFMVSACGGAGPRTGGGTQPSPREVSVTSDQLVVTGPDGFCIDPSGTRDRQTTAFVLLGNCAVIANSRRQDQPDVNAVLTASVSDADPSQTLRASIPDLDLFFRSEQGLGLLSRSSDPTSVEVLDSFHQGDVYFVQASDSSQGIADGLSAEYWRAYQDVGARIVTLSVLSSEDQPVSTEASLRTLRAFSVAIAEANSTRTEPLASVGVTSPTVDVSPSPPTESRPSDGTLWNVGLFRRILG
jgi:hypothetical protein